MGRIKSSRSLRARRGSSPPRITSFRSIIELWGASRADMASDIGGTAANVSKWWQRDWIPPEWWMVILRTGRARAAGVSANTMAMLAAGSKDEPKQIGATR